MDYSTESIVLPTTTEWGDSNLDLDTIEQLLDDPASVVGTLGKPDLSPCAVGSKAYLVFDANTFILTNEDGWVMKGQIPEPPEGEVQ